MKTLVASILALGLVAACSDGEKMPSGGDMVDAQLKTDLETLKTAKIFFGHHSVGENLLQGFSELTTEAGIPAKIEESRVGENRDPKSKVDAFVKRVLSEPQGGLQLAYMKFCYVDFEPSTKVDEVLGWYKAAVERIRRERPDVQLMHVTTPLTVYKSDMKTKVKRMIGREIWEDAANARRLEYNERMKEAFRGEPIFDLALMESTRPSGQRQMYELDGKQYPSLYEGYAADDGHLNAIGRKIGARAMAHALAEALRTRPATAQQ